MSALKRLAVIEAGTKGIRLLVVRRRGSAPGMDILESRGEVGNLGESLDRNHGRMQSDNIRASLHHVRRFFRLARRRHADRIVLVGTEVFRRAVNVGEFRESLPRPLALRVLSAEEEAVGSFLAARWGLRRMLPWEGQLVVIDLGGGSLEVVAGGLGSPSIPLASISLRSMGTLALREVWHHAATSEDRERFGRYIDDEIGRYRLLFDELRPTPGTGLEALRMRLVAGLGSTVTDSAWILAGRPLNRYKSRDVNGLRAAVPELGRLRDHLLELPAPDVTTAAFPPRGIRDPLGHQLGLAALLAVLRALDAPAITACGTGLRFGVAYAHLHGIPLRVVKATPRSRPV